LGDVWNVAFARASSVPGTYVIVYTENGLEYKGILHLSGAEENAKELTIKYPKLILRDKDWAVVSEIEMGKEIMFTKGDIRRVLFFEKLDRTDKSMTTLDSLVGYNTSRLITRLLIFGLVAIGLGFVVLWFLGVTINATGVVELEKALIEIDGFLIAFTGIIFTGMLAEVRSRVDRAFEQNATTVVERLEKTSRTLRLGALGSFVFFVISLASAVGSLSNSLAFPTSSTYLSVALVAPFGFMVEGLVLLLVNLSLLVLA